jgi:putative MATE family efflux protein
MSHAERLLDAPVLPAILRLAAPGVVLAVFQTAVAIADTHFVGRLGTDALAGLALVFPLVMLLQMTSAGAMGGGVSSAVARALGAGEEAAARNLAAHALVIAVAAGLVFAILLLTLGPVLYALLGGNGSALDQALVYSDVLFSGAVVVWLANTLASILRGTGNMFVPAFALVGAALVQIPLSGALTLGWTPFPRVGIGGAALAYGIAFGLAAIAMAVYLWRSPLRPRSGDWKLAARQFHEILRVGALSSINSLQTVLTAVIVTGFVGTFGTAAIAGYGVGVRLELLQIPIVFAIGQALVVLVGTNIGRGRHERAKSIAWIGTALAIAVTFTIGILAALFPAAWVRIFSDDPAVLEAGSTYLRTVAPFYGLFGGGMALYFASQGAGRMLLPMLAGTARLAIVAAGGYLAVWLASSLAALFVVIACGLAVFGGLTAAAIYRGAWDTRPRRDGSVDRIAGGASQKGQIS